MKTIQQIIDDMEMWQDGPKRSRILHWIEQLRAHVSHDDAKLGYDPLRKVVCIDFDGVLHSYRSGWKGTAVIPDEPIPGAIKWLAEMILTGADIRIFSARCNDVEGIEAMKKWLLNNGFSHYWMRYIKFEPGKPKAHIIIDDRAMRFTGEFPDPKEILGFVPWRI